MPKNVCHPSRKLLTESSYAAPVPQNSLAKLLSLDQIIPTAQGIFEEEISDESDIDQKTSSVATTFKDQFTNQEWREAKKKFFNFKSVGRQRKWLHELLLSDSSDEDDSEIDENDFAFMCHNHQYANKTSDRFCLDSLYYEDNYSFYGSSLISEHDKFHEIQKKRTKSEKTRHKLKMEKKKMTKSSAVSLHKLKQAENKAERQLLQQEKDIQCKRKKIWNFIIKKDIPKAHRSRMNTRGTNLQLLKKVAQACQRERRKEALRSQKTSKEALLRARRMAREMLLYWRKFDKVEKEHRKKAEKEAIEQRKQDEEMREMKRQQRKLNFLITQTELYAHFMGKKMKSGQADTHDDILKKLDNTSNDIAHRTVQGGVINSNIDDDYDANLMKSQAIQNVEKAVMQQRKNVSTYQKSKDMQSSFDGNFSLANPTLEKEKELPQPKIFNGRLKSYQLKGMNWLVSLYEKGINGILADEMGLGKTVQSIVFLAYLAEVHNIWGPFLVVAPASTLHNWQQEFAKFLPCFKVLPYWGDSNDRKSLRKYWNQKSFYSGNSEEDSPFHVLITSYQLIVQDVKYMQRIRWQYLVLDEAHAIKSSQSLRWKILLGYNCRNRLLLTGTPIQNSMAELWALLHFIMPTLFDNHDEFNEWFSKDIENHATEKRPNLDQNQLSRLHMILKPFMLRRVKKDVENELSDKIEIKLICEMSLRQKRFYQAVKNKILIEDLLQSSLSSSSSTDTKSASILMNLVMQFRKVCNHPELFERKEPLRALNFSLPPVPMATILFEECIFSELPHDKVSLYHKNFLIWNSYYISQSLKDNGGCFSFSRFINLSPEQCRCIFLSICHRLTSILLFLMDIQKQRLNKTWKQKKKSCYLSRDDLQICNEKMPSSFCLTSCRDNLSGYKPCLIREISSTESRSTTNCGVPRKSCITRNCQPTYYPKFLHTIYPKVNSPPPSISCSSRRATYHLDERFIATPELDTLLRSGIKNVSASRQYDSLYFSSPPQGFNGLMPIVGWSMVKLPDRSTLISDSGKLTVLDQLLSQLKLNDHRVLIYSQMTKMIDLLEEFMNFRHYSYMRLDGSSKISDRRDMVADFQSKQDIFAFLLSTRAGGLGINLTAADTVIFYDSDWNPTVDQQAMDRAHRLGQTKQVTVYRLVTKGTVEERILNRAREKSEIQSIVISGGEFNKDVLRPREVVSLLLDDEELERKLKQRQQDGNDVSQTGRPSRRKRKKNTASSEDVKPKKQRQVNESKIMQETVTGIDLFELDENSTSSSIELGNYLPQNDESKFSSRPLSSASNSSPVTVEGGKKKGRPPGKGRGKTKSGTLAKAAASAAALAGAVAGSTAAYAAYGYSFQASNGC